ncbi:hypothetical protein BJY00DRAFT_315601 [Aspergillus carlsbadensis]|nr:hypothetical protein BJY00DRAFT_315601 [Aspergillus carlsbadensis]
MSVTDAQTAQLYEAFQLDLARAVLGLDCLLGATSLGLGIGALVLRRRQRQQPDKFQFAELPQWTVIAFLWVNFLFAIFISVRYGLLVHGTAVLTDSLEQWYYVGNILPFFFLHAGNSLLIYILYYVLHLMQSGCPKTELPSNRRVKTHWALVGLSIVMSIVDWGLQTKNQLIPKAYEDGYTLTSQIPYARAFAGFDTATYLVRLGISGEILWGAVRLCVRTVGRRSRWRALSILLVITTTFFLAQNLMWAIWGIRWMIVPIATAPFAGTDSQNAYYAADVCQACFYLLIYIGLIPFYLRWGWLARRDEQGQAERDEKEEMERAALPAEADSRPRAVAEVEGKGVGVEMDSVAVNEADSVPVLEADSGRVFGPPVELDSVEVKK